MDEELTSYPAQARCCLVSPLITCYPNISDEHQKRLDHSTKDYMFAEVKSVNPLKMFDYPIVSLELFHLPKRAKNGCTMESFSDVILQLKDDNQFMFKEKQVKLKQKIFAKQFRR